MYEVETYMVERRRRADDRFKAQVQRDSCTLCWVTGITIAVGLNADMPWYGALGLMIMFFGVLGFSKYLINR